MAASSPEETTGANKPLGAQSNRGERQRDGKTATAQDKREGYRKRQRESKETPPSLRRQPKKPRAGGPEKGSYAVLASELPKLAIVHSAQREDIMKEQSVMIEEGLMEVVDGIPVGDFTPRFQETYLHRGSLKVTCADKQSAIWLEGQVTLVKVSD